MNRFGFYNTSLNYPIDSKSTRDETYIVKSGDTLYKIAKKYGISVDSLLKANNLSTTQIIPNQVIVIPVKVPNGAMYFEEYIIEPNDTIDNIANKLGITTDLIGRYNDITKLVLMENQVLNIPKKYDIYTIEDGDTIDTILNKTGMTLEQLVDANSKKWLSIGNTIFVK